MSIFVTGGAGFIGSNFVIGWLDQHDELIINIDKLTYAGNLNNLSLLDGNEFHVFVKGDIGDKTLLKSLLARYQPRAIVNFAAESHVDRSLSKPNFFLENNTSIVINLFNSIIFNKLKPRFVQISTDEVFGALTKKQKSFVRALPVHRQLCMQSNV